MSYYEDLNKVIDTIEKELTNKIDYKELAKIVGISSYSLQRTFAFLTGITLTEYIRKRRLSKAAEEINRTNAKIIDIALKYQYDSPISFSNAFKRMHGIPPSKVKNSNQQLKIFEKIQFKSAIEEIKEFKYRIIEMEEQEFYCVTTGVISYDDNKSISDLYKKCRQNGTMDFFVQNSNQNELYYGIDVPFLNGSKYTGKGIYYIGGKVRRKDLKKVKVPKGLWVCFLLQNKGQKDINKLYDYMYSKWLPESKYEEKLFYPQLEIYYKDSCEICVAIEE